MRRKLILVTMIATGLVSVTGCHRVESAPHQVVVVGIDGAEWKVIEWLWQQDRLPNLMRIANEGVATRLSTIHHASPVIWTSVATGVTPTTHGITDFAVPTSGGDQPVSSTLRRVPALWNMVSAADRRVAVLGWWASWPAESVDGIVVSDRALAQVDHRVFPAEFADQFKLIEQRARAHPIDFGGNDSTRIQDNVMARTAVALASEGFDLMMIYFRGVDITSHFVWKYFEPEAFNLTDLDEIEDGRQRLARAYEAVDLAIGEIRQTVGPEATIMVLSDHGFHAMDEEETRVIMDFDAVLAHLGLLKRTGGTVDMSRSKLYTYASPTHTTSKKLRFCREDREQGGTVTDGDINGIRLELAAGLATVRWPDGLSAFAVRGPGRKERKKGAELVVDVLMPGAGRQLLAEGEPIPGAVREMTRLSGTHSSNTDGVFFASGPMVDPAADLADINVLDITPTVLFALGLPVADDFDGHPHTELFTGNFQRRNPLRSIATWGGPRESEGTGSAVDEKLIEELAALGYIQ